MNDEPKPIVPTQNSGGLNPKTAGLLAYLFGWLGGLIILLIEKDNKEVRFHALQSIAFNICVAIILFPVNFISIGLGEILYHTNKTLGLIVGIPLTILFNVTLIGILIFWISLMIKAYKEEHYKLPFIGNFVEKYV